MNVQGHMHTNSQFRRLTRQKGEGKCVSASWPYSRKRQTGSVRSLFMKNNPPDIRQRDESPGAEMSRFKDNPFMFQLLFERAVDAIFLLDPQAGMFVDCNQAAVELMRADSKEKLLQVRPEDLSPPLQQDGTPSNEKRIALVALAEQHGAHRFEWVARCFDGQDVPLEVSLTPIHVDGRSLHVVIPRDISERKQVERQLLELNQSLERRVGERTVELSTSEAQFRALVEHAPEAIVVFDGDTGRFLFGNKHACNLYGVPMERLPELSPVDVSPEFQPNGRRSSELVREIMDEVLAGGTPVFEWLHKQPGGKLIPTEVRLLRLPAEKRNLIRASILDNTERKGAELALRGSEEKFRALFEGSSQGVVLQDENQILEVNPAAVRIMGCQQPQDLLGKHPSETSPLFQPNGEISAVLSRKHIQKCMTSGSARFEWMSRTPQGVEVPLEVALTRIQWSGRQVIQALINDISERKKAEAELRASESRLRESEARFSAAFDGSPILIVIARMSDQKYVLVNDAFVKWSGFAREELLGRDSTEFTIWESQAERDTVWADLQRAGSLRERECRFRDRRGDRTTMLISFEVIQINRTPHLLAMGLDITGRKKAEEESRASEARLRESEARFSAAFQASPAFISIMRLSDEKYVLANDAYLNWLGHQQDEVLGRTCVELGLWVNPGERDLILKDIRTAGSIRQRECHWKNRGGERFTILLSAETIKLDDTPHLLSMALDITQRKRAEEELLKTLEREKELGQLKSNFVSMVSHEFRTPLGIIQSSAELLRDFYQKMPPIEREEQLESITRNTRRMAGMMEEILVLSRLEVGKLDCQPTTLDLNFFCRRVLDEVLSATNRRCPIKLLLNQVLPPARADEQLLGHIFTNLLSNAVKYSEPGETVRFEVERDGPDLVCRIYDQGIGISEEDRRHLFKAFHRGSNVGTRPGTGLGLLLVKRCTDLHNGQLQLNSTIGAGTTVTVRLPVFGANS